VRHDVDRPRRELAGELECGIRRGDAVVVLLDLVERQVGLGGIGVVDLDGLVVRGTLDVLTDDQLGMGG
jgi:hypothetical protein